MTNKVMLRTTERKSFLSCRQQWWWSFNDGLEAVQSAPALRFGSLIHGALALWYPPGIKRGPHPAKSFIELYDAQIEAGLRDFDVRLDSEEGWVEARELGIEMLKHYVQVYGKDDHIKVVSAEMPFEVEVFDRKGRYLVTYVGQLDLVYQDRRNLRYGFIETKTASSISTSHLSMDEQASSYWLFGPEALQNAGVIPKGQDIDFILYNFLRKSGPDQRPVNADGHHLNKPSKDKLVTECERLGLATKGTVEALTQALTAKGINVPLLGEVSKSQPPPFFLRKPVYRDTIDHNSLMRRIQMQAWEMRQVRSGRLPVYKNPSFMYPDQHCRGCEFRDMCEVHETGGDWQAIRNATMKKWDPYAEHRDEILEDD